jgi:hypothetical protein
MEANKSGLLRNVELACEWTRKMRAFERSEQYLDELSSQAENMLRHLRHLLLQMRAFAFGGDFMDIYDEEGDECEFFCDRFYINKLKMPIMIDHSPSKQTLKAFLVSF